VGGISRHWILIFVGALILSACDADIQSCKSAKGDILTKREIIDRSFFSLGQIKWIFLDQSQIERRLLDGCCSVFVSDGRNHLPKNVKYVFSYLHESLPEAGGDKLKKFEIHFDKCGNIISNDMDEIMYVNSISRDEYDEIRKHNRSEQ